MKAARAHTQHEMSECNTVQRHCAAALCCSAANAALCSAVQR
jgi:hypothetical protein